MDDTGVRAGLAGLGTLFAAVGAAALKIGKEAIQIGMDFEYAMAHVAATMGWSVDELNTVGSEAQKQFQMLEDAAREAGATTRFTALESAEALNYLAQAGYNATESVYMLPILLKGAQAGQMGIAETANMLVDVMSAFGISIDQTERLLDVMARTAQRTNTDMSQLGQALLTVGATARVLPGGFEEAALHLGLLADNGVKGAAGGKALRNIILDLTAPLNKAGDMLAELGVSAFDASGMMRPLQDIIHDLNYSMQNFTDQQKMTAISAIFNRIDLKSVNALLATTSDEFARLAFEIEQSSGAITNAAQVQEDNLKGYVTIAKSQLQELALVLYDTMDEPLKEVVKGITEFLTEMMKSDSVTNMAHAIAGLADMIATLAISLLPMLADILSLILPPITEVLKAILPPLVKIISEVVATLKPVIDRVLPLFIRYIEILIEAFMPIIE